MALNCGPRKGEEPLTNKAPEVRKSKTKASNSPSQTTELQNNSKPL